MRTWCTFVSGVLQYVAVYQKRDRANVDMLAYLGPLLVCLLGKVIYSLGKCYPIIPKIPFNTFHPLIFFGLLSNLPFPP